MVQQRPGPTRGFTLDALSDRRGCSEIRVLHVEDEPSFADLTETGLTRANDDITVEHVPSVAGGIQVLADDYTQVDCVVSDYDLGDKNGIEFLRTVRERRCELPFILFTGKGSEAVAADALAAGATDYLQKEAGLDQFTILSNRIEHAVREVRTAQTVERAMQAIETAREGIGLVDFDESGNFVYCNDSYSNLLGYDPGELVGRHWRDIYPSEAAAERMYEEATDQLQSVGRWTGTTTFEMADGDPVRLDHRLDYAEDGTLVCTITPTTRDPSSGLVSPKRGSRIGTERFDSSPHVD